MAKRFVLLACLLLAGAVSQARVGFSFHLSRLGSMFKILEVLSEGRPHHPYFELADSSRLYTAAIRKKIEAAGQASWESIRYQSYPASRQYGHNTKDFYHTAACRSENLAKLRERTRGFLPLKEQANVLDALQALAPVFDALVWNPCQAHADSQTKALSLYADEHNLSEFFTKAIRFYGAAIPDTMDYRVYINPIPKGFGYSTAQHSKAFWYWMSLIKKSGGKAMYPSSFMRFAMCSMPSNRRKYSIVWKNSSFLPKGRHAFAAGLPTTGSMRRWPPPLATAPATVSLQDTSIRRNGTTSRP